MFKIKFLLEDSDSQTSPDFVQKSSNFAWAAANKMCYVIAKCFIKRLSKGRLICYISYSRNDIRASKKYFSKFLEIVKSIYNYTL